MSDYLVLGMESIKFGTVNGTTYQIPTTLTNVVHIVPDSAKIIFEQPEPTQIMTEESDDVLIEIAGKTVKGFEFATYDAGNSIMILAFGGTASSTDIWLSPVTALGVVQKAIQIISTTVNGKKHKFEMGNCSLRAGGELKFGKTDAGQLTFAGSVLKCGAIAPMRRTLV